MLLTLTVALPLLGALLVLAIGRGEGREKLVQWIALGASLATLALALMLWWWFDPSTADYQFVERRQWMPAFGISYHVGLDGISLMLVVLTAFLTPIALLSSWESVHKNVKNFSFFILALETAIAGKHWDRVKNRDDELTYNLKTLDELHALMPAFDWNDWRRQAEAMMTHDVGRKHGGLAAVARALGDDFPARRDDRVSEVMTGRDVRERQQEAD